MEESKGKRGRPLINGERPLTATERSQRRRQKLKESGIKFLPIKMSKEAADTIEAYCKTIGIPVTHQMELLSRMIIEGWVKDINERWDDIERMSAGLREISKRELRNDSISKH